LEEPAVEELAPELEGLAGEEELPPEPEGVELEGVDGVEPPPEVSRSLSLWLPRSCGVTSDTKFSADVEPVIRRVFSTGPGKTFAVRTPIVTFATLVAGALRRCQINAAPASITTASTKPIQRPAFEGFLGRGGTISGLGEGGWGLIKGAGATLIAVY
jgi:hypothetical protein